MGYANGRLIQAHWSAKSTLKRIGDAIDETQRECPHPIEDRSSIGWLEAQRIAREKGHTIYMCKRCSKGNLPGPDRAPLPSVPYDALEEFKRLFGQFIESHRTKR